MVWCGLVGFGLVWFGLVWFGVVWLENLKKETLNHKSSKGKSDSKSNFISNIEVLNLAHKLSTQFGTQIVHPIRYKSCSPNLDDKYCTQLGTNF